MKRYNITVNGTKYEVIVEEAGNATHAPVYSAPVVPQASTQKESAPEATAFGSNKITAPMPGTILDVNVKVGQAVKKGDVVCVLEAMKMENDIPAPCDGVVTSVNVQKGASVATNDVLISLN